MSHCRLNCVRILAFQLHLSTVPLNGSVASTLVAEVVCFVSVSLLVFNSYIHLLLVK